MLLGGGDLGIYLNAATELRAGDLNIYRLRESTGPYPYPPVVLLPFAGLQLVLSDTLIRWVYSIGMGLATLFIVRDLPRLVAGAEYRMRPWQWVAFAVLFQRCIAQNLSHGQLSLWVGALLLLGTISLQRGRDVTGGVWLGCAAALKLTPLLFVAALPFMGRPRAAIATLLTTLLLVYVVPLPLLGWHEHVMQLDNFHRAMVLPLFGQGEMPVTEFYGGHSIKGTLDYVLQPLSVDLEGRTVNLLSISDSALKVTRLAWSAMIATLLAVWFWRARRLPSNTRLVEQASVVMMAMAFFSPITRAYHLAGALLPFALFCRGPDNRRDWLWWLAAIGALFALTLRQKNLLGETLWRYFDLCGLMHMAMIGMVVWMMTRANPGGSTGDESGARPS